MKFKDYQYERLNYEDIKKEYSKLLDELSLKENPKEFEEVFYKINEYRTHLQTMATICMIRHSIDTSDKFYEAEQEYWDETAPRINVFEERLADICLNFPRKDELNIPSIYFKICEYTKKVFNESIIEDLQKENKLASEYGKLKASAKIEFEGKIYNLSSIAPFTLSNDRKTREEATIASNKFYEDNEAEFDRIYDELVHVRDTIAKKLGFKDFVELAYYRMWRFDYNREMVANYRKQVLEDIVPVTKEIYAKQKQRLGLDELKAWDLNYEFKSGNPKPIGTKDDLVNNALKMYQKMSDVTGKFFKMMCDEELFDLETKPNKQMGGYMAPIPGYKKPFIFSNFNGTSGDVDVLTHEAGHGLQTYLTYQNYPNIILDLTGPTMEACEIHSMSMEFFAHPYMKDFFGNDEEKYIYSHIAGALTFIPYGILVDHFQHEVYENPNMTKEERKATWSKLEKMYCPDRHFDDIPILKRGGWFFKQGHIFESPFYYIDYTLAQVCALQFFVRMLKNDETCFSDYINLCKAGGYDTFLGLLKLANLKSPFEDGSLKEIAQAMKAELDKIDDTKL